MTHVQLGLTQGMSDWVRRVSQARDWKQRAALVRDLPAHDVKLQLQSIKNRATGKSMGEHSEETAKAWEIRAPGSGRLALKVTCAPSPGKTADFSATSSIPSMGSTMTRFPAGTRRSRPSRVSRRRSIRRAVKGRRRPDNSSPLTDGAAALWVASDAGLSRLPASTPRVRLVNFEVSAVDIWHEGLLMAPAYGFHASSRAARSVTRTSSLWEIHEAFTAQVLYQLKALESPTFLERRWA